MKLSKGKNFNAKYEYLIKSENWEDYFSPKDIFFLNTNEQKIDLDAWKKLNKINKNIKFQKLKGNIFKKNDVVIITSKMLVKLWRNFKTELKNISQVTNFLITINHYMFKAPVLTNLMKLILLIFCVVSLIYSKYLKKDEIDKLKLHKIIEIPYLPNKFSESVGKNQTKKCAIVGHTLPVWSSHILSKNNF